MHPFGQFAWLHFLAIAPQISSLAYVYFCLWCYKAVDRRWLSVLHVGCPTHHTMKQNHTVSWTCGPNSPTSDTQLPTLPSYSMFMCISLYVSVFRVISWKHSIGYTRLLCPFRLSPIIYFLLTTGVYSSTSHSFHQGGASFAYQAGVPIELIKVLEIQCSSPLSHYTFDNTSAVCQHPIQTHLITFSPYH